MDLIDLLRGEGHFGDDIRVGGEAVEGVGFRGNVVAVFLPEAVEIVLHVEAVHALGGTVDVVILAPVVAVDGEALFEAVADLGSAQGNEAIATGEGVDVHFVFVEVGAVQDLLTDLGPLPLEPVGDVGEFGFALGGLQLAVLLHIPALAAVVAEDFRALGSHPEFGFAVGALVEDFLQALCPVGFRDEDALFQLVAVFIILHGLLDDGIDLIGGHGLHLLGGQDLTEGGAQGNIALVLVGPEGGIQVVAVVDGHHQGNLVHLHQLAQGIGQERGGADGGVAGFGIHAQDVTVLDDFANGLDQVDVIGELAGADGTDPGQQPGHHVVAVDVDHIVDLSGVGHHGGQLKIDEGLMIAEEDVGRFQALHVDGLQSVFLAGQAEFRQDPNDPGPEFGLAHGIFRGFVVLFVAVIYFHM